MTVEGAAYWVGGFLILALAVATVVDRVRSFPWRRRIRSIPSDIVAAWEGAGPFTGLGAVVLVIGYVATLLFPIPTYHYLPTDAPYAPIDWPAVFAGIGLLGGMGWVGLGLAFFLFLAVKGEERPAEGLHTVIGQRVHDTGNYAQALQIDAALRDEDAGGKIAPKFED